MRDSVSMSKLSSLSALRPRKELAFLRLESTLESMLLLGSGHSARKTFSHFFVFSESWFTLATYAAVSTKVVQ